MFELKDYKETAFTPELGGVFNDMQLEIEYFDQEKENDLMIEGMAKPDIDFSVRIKLMNDSLRHCVHGWKNVNGEFNEENKAKLFRNHINDLTGIERPREDQSEPVKFYTLGDYILKFRKDKENFLAD